MIDIDDLQLIGSGATANVYLYEKNKIIKLFNEDYDLNAVNYEAKIAHEINYSYVKSPKYYQTIRVNDKNGIIYEFIEGELLVSILLKSSLLKSIKLIKKLVQTQIDINQKSNKNIANQIDRFSYLINKSSNIDQYKSTLINGLKSIKQDSFICHGDLHAGNVIVNNSIFITIDWMNCYAGNKEGDLLIPA
jgi:thiamine kinase-like enzyme